MNRIVRKINKLIEENKKGFVAFIPLKYPTEEIMINTFLELEKGGADIIEIGFSQNPYMDGEVIRQAYNTVKENNGTIDDIFEVVKKIRVLSELPIILMTYKDDLELIASKREMLISSGIDGVIVPDINEELKIKLKFDKDLIGINLMNIESEFTNEDIDGFKYCISNKGCTGNSNLDKELIKKQAKKFEKQKDKMFIGFGMGKIDNIVSLKDYFGGVIIGTEIVRIISKDNLNKGVFFEKIKEYRDYIKEERFI
ncbi:MAG: tryptophan synthase subunit alpha [Sarcina sp.]